MLYDSNGTIIGTFTPAGSPPPSSPPEPPAASAFVGRPPRPGMGGPGAAVLSESEKMALTAVADAMRSDDTFAYSSWPDGAVHYRKR